MTQVLSASVTGIPSAMSLSTTSPAEIISQTFQSHFGHCVKIRGDPHPQNMCHTAFEDSLTQVIDSDAMLKAGVYGSGIHLMRVPYTFK